MSVWTVSGCLCHVRRMGTWECVKLIEGTLTRCVSVSVSVSIISIISIHVDEYHEGCVERDSRGNILRCVHRMRSIISVNL